MQRPLWEQSEALVEDCESGSGKFKLTGGGCKPIISKKYTGC